MKQEALIDTVADRSAVVRKPRLGWNTSLPPSSNDMAGLITIILKQFHVVRGCGSR